MDLTIGKASGTVQETSRGRSKGAHHEFLNGLLGKARKRTDKSFTDGGQMIPVPKGSKASSVGQSIYGWARETAHVKVNVKPRVANNKTVGFDVTYVRDLTANEIAKVEASKEKRKAAQEAARLAD